MGPGTAPHSQVIFVVGNQVLVTELNCMAIGQFLSQTGKTRWSDFFF